MAQSFELRQIPFSSNWEAAKPSRTKHAKQNLKMTSNCLFFEASKHPNAWPLPKTTKVISSIF